MVKFSEDSISVMEIAQAGVRSRERAPAAEEMTENSGSAKRIKVDNGELSSSSSKSVRITPTDGGDVTTALKNCEDLRDLSSDTTSLISGDIQASCCSSNGSEKLESADLEETNEAETVIRYKLDGSESTPTIDFKEESGELDSSTTSKPSTLIDVDSRRRTIPKEKTPPADELEDFFTKAEENLHKSFIDKYNFDIVNDVPLKGRFEWVKLNP